jgi:hypothetical protein
MLADDCGCGDRPTLSSFCLIPPHLETSFILKIVFNLCGGSPNSIPQKQPIRSPSMADDSIGEYKYQPLPNQKDKRILVLKPATNFTTPLECILEYRPWLSEKLQREEEDLENFLFAKQEYDQFYRLWQSVKREYDDSLDRMTSQEGSQGKPLAKRLAEVNYEMVNFDFPSHT